MLSTMTMGRRRLVLGIGAALLIGGWGATRYAAQQQSTFPPVGGRRTIGIYSPWHAGELYGQTIYIGGVVSMAVGAGLIGFAALPPTSREPKKKK